MIEWQPIETAPKDGTDILVYMPDVNLHGTPAFYQWCIVVAYWERHFDKWSTSHVSGCDWDEDLVSNYATHWMPLPKPPA